MSNKKENLKDRVDQRQAEVAEIQKVHEQLQALREIHKQENTAFATQRSSLIFKDEIQSESQTKKK